MQSILPLQRTSVHAAPIIIYNLQVSIYIMLLSVDRQTVRPNPTHLLISQPGYQATDKTSAVLLRFLGLRFEFGRPERKYPAGRGDA
jgi:hypothetical protein